MEKKLPMWKPIKMGDRLPCQSFLRKKDGEILKLSTVAGVKVGQDAYYLPVEDVIEEIKNYPIEESEDERIRKKIIKLVKEHSVNHERCQMEAWLEKKGEQKDILENAVLDGNKDGLIADTIKTKGEQKLNIKKENALVDYSEFKEHLAAIFNAYNGIVIDVQSAVDANADTLIHLACKYQKPVKVPKFKAGDFIQFNGMGHTRYTIKEVCGLSYYINTCNKRMDMSYTDANFELVEKKSSWSEEDERILNGLISSLARIGANTRTDSTSINYTFSKEIDWFKSLKNRLQPQPKQEWSEEDEKMIDAIYSCVDSHYNGLAKDALLIWLKSLRHQSQWKPSDEHYELEEFAKIVRGNLTGISKAVQKLFEAKYLQLTGNKMYGGFKD